MSHETPFLRALSKTPSDEISLYCNGYPERAFMDKYVKLFNIKGKEESTLLLYDEDYYLLKAMGFDAVSLWDFRRGKGEYYLDPPYNTIKVDGWGRVYKNQWYSWDGVFKSHNVLENWNYLTSPPKKELELLKEFLVRVRLSLDPILSLPGLFEKTWQSMGYVTFSRYLKNNLPFIESVIEFFFRYLLRLINELQSVGAEIFLVADDCAYKYRTFLPNDLWKHLFFEKYAHIVNIVHQRRQKIIIHSDGNISNLIDQFIDIGFDAVESLEPNAGVDIFDLFKKHKNRICFVGNLDVSTLLSFGTVSEVRSYVLKLIQNSRASGSPLVISPTQQIHSIVHPENVKEMIETAKKYKFFVQ